MRGYAAIGLDKPKFGGNIGGAMRAAHCYGASMVVIGGKQYVDEITNTTKAHRHIPTLVVADLFDAIPFDCTPVAIEFLPNARSLPSYTHPQRAYYIFGREDQTLDKKILDRCKDVVYIPTSYCMNLASTVNVVLYDRLCKTGDFYCVKTDENALGLVNAH